MASIFSDWRIGLGFNVANGSLTDVETQFENNNVAFGNTWLPKITPYNRFPSVVTTGFGKPFGYGRGRVVWEFTAIPNLTLEYLIETYFKSSGVWVATQKCTIKTRDTSPADWIRLNAYPIFVETMGAIEDYAYYYTTGARLVFQIHSESS